MTKKPLKGYEGVYSITDTGKVYSHHTKRFKRTQVNIHGREVVQLGKVPKQVSRLVALTFIPNPENKPQVNHIDGNKLNNHASNLEWVTAKENHAHAFILGLRTPLRPERQHKALFSWKTIEEIRQLYASGISQAELSRKYGCHQTTIHKIVSHKSWRN